MDYVTLYSKYIKDQKNSSDDVTERYGKKWKLQKKNKISDKNYIGIYEDNWFGKIEILLKEKQLWFKSYRSPKLNRPMYYFKANTFAFKWEYRDIPCNALAMFTLNDEGKAQNIKMKGISPNVDFSFDFYDLDLKRVRD